MDFTESSALLQKQILQLREKGYVKNLSQNLNIGKF